MDGLNILGIVSIVFIVVGLLSSADASRERIADIKHKAEQRIVNIENELVELEQRITKIEQHIGMGE